MSILLFKVSFILDELGSMKRGNQLEKDIKRKKKLSKMVKDRGLSQLTPQSYAQETLLIALFSLDWCWPFPA